MVELRQHRTETRKLYKAAQRNRTKEGWDLYKSSFNEYKDKIRKAKWELIKEFSASIKDINEAARLRKVLSKDPIIPSNIRRPDNT